MAINIPESAVPEGYVVIQDGGAAVVVRGELAGVVRAAGAVTPAALLAASRPVKTLRGRGEVAVIEFEGRTLVLRQDRRGGILAPLGLSTRAGIGKSLDELRWSETLRTRGAPVPLVWAAFIEDAGPGLFRHGIATEFLAGTIDLAALVRLRLPVRARRRLLGSAGLAVRKLHDAGAVHGDLNLKNVLVDPGRPEAGGAVIDLDRLRFPEPLGMAHRLTNLIRLARSEAKFSIRAVKSGDGKDSGFPMDDRDKLAFLRGYAQGDQALLRSLAPRLARKLFILRRLRWLMFGTEKKA